MRPVMSYGQRNNFVSQIPFQGRGDFGFVSSQSNFTPGITIKMLPLRDLSRPQQVNPSEFDELVKELNQQFIPGRRLSGVVINSNHQKKGGERVIGRFLGFKLDRKNQIIRAFIHDSEINKRVEIYPETIGLVNESQSFRAKTFMEFLIQD